MHHDEAGVDADVGVGVSVAALKSGESDLFAAIEQCYVVLIHRSSLLINKRTLSEEGTGENT